MTLPAAVINTKRFVAVDKQIIRFLAQKTRQPLRLLSDKMLPWLRQRNVAPFGKLKYDKIRAPITIIFEIKTIGRYVNPIAGLQRTRQFPIVAQDIYKELWYRYLGPSKTYQEAKQLAARMLDNLWLKIYQSNEPIVAVRMFIFDWHYDAAVPANILNWRLASERTFEGWRLDTMNLQAWGIPADRPNIDLMRSGKINGVKYHEHLVQQPTKNIIEIELGVSTDSLINDTIVQILSKRAYGDNSKLIMVINSDVFKAKVKNALLNKFSSDSEFRTDCNNHGGRRKLIRALSGIIETQLAMQGIKKA